MLIGWPESPNTVVSNDICKNVVVTVRVYRPSQGVLVCVVAKER